MEIFRSEILVLTHNAYIQFSMTITPKSVPFSKEAFPHPEPNIVTSLYPRAPFAHFSDNTFHKLSQFFKYLLIWLH